MDVVSAGAAAALETVGFTPLVEELFVTKLQVPEKLPFAGFSQVHVDRKFCSASCIMRWKVGNCPE